MDANAIVGDSHIVNAKSAFDSDICFNFLFQSERKIFYEK